MFENRKIAKLSDSKALYPEIGMPKNDHVIFEQGRAVLSKCMKDFISLIFCGTEQGSDIIFICIKKWYVAIKNPNKKQMLIIRPENSLK